LGKRIVVVVVAVVVMEEGEDRGVRVGSGREGFGGKGNELSAWGARK
jgi:hypothetical protein